MTRRKGSVHSSYTATPTGQMRSTRVCREAADIAVRERGLLAVAAGAETTAEVIATYVAGGLIDLRVLSFVTGYLVREGFVGESVYQSLVRGPGGVQT